VMMKQVVTLTEWMARSFCALQPQDLEVAGRPWQVTCVSMGNPHALVYSSSDGPIKVRTARALIEFRGALFTRPSALQLERRCALCPARRVPTQCKLHCASANAAVGKHLGRCLSEMQWPPARCGTIACCSAA